MSIIDLVTGRQPIASADGNRRIVFNGEIYNYRDLRKELLARGRRFATDSDTEVILCQYEQEGPACVHRFNGMFAFAIWDAEKQTLFLARDRMGVKPLYYFWDGAHFLFASEIKALLATGFVPRAVNPQAMWDYLTFRYVPQPETIWRHVFKLPPGHTLTLTPGQPEPRPVRYWDIPFAAEVTGRSEEELTREFTQLFLDAVRLRLIADVPVGILLSGGLDSSSVAAAVAEQHNARLSSFSIAFQDSPQIDELPFARQVAEHVGTDHHEVVIGHKEFCDFLPALAHFTDEPLADLAAVPLYYVSRLARERVKVVLSGEGSDEVLGGYDFDLWVRDLDRRRSFQRLPRWLRTRPAQLIARRLCRRYAQRLAQASVPADLRAWPEPPNMTNHRSSGAKQALFREAAGLTDSMSSVRTDLLRAGYRDPLGQLLYVFCQSWLVEDLLMKADRMSMANSIELRTPFLDYRLVEWAARAPAMIKVGRNAAGEYETKRILRSFARPRLPESILGRPKMGFPVPLYGWVSDRLKPWAHELLDASDTQVTRWLEPAAVRAELARGTAANAPLIDRHLLWDLLIMEIWSREWRPL